jgi:hypothetical protein
MGMDSFTVVEPMLVCPTPVGPRDNSQRTFAQIWGVWPSDPRGENRQVNVRTGYYKALSFTYTGESAGVFSSIEPQPPGVIGSPVVSISECPGDFGVAALGSTLDPDCVNGPGLKVQVRWSNITNPFPGCQLEDGTLYFLNIYFGTPEGIPNCSDPSFCTLRGNNAPNNGIITSN